MRPGTRAPTGAFHQRSSQRRHQEQRRRDDHHSRSQQEPELGGVAPGPDRVDYRQQPDNRGEAVQSAQARGADPIAQVVREAERGEP